MSDLIYVEPASELRPAFASWGLAQNPPLQTASERGWDVPLDLYAAVPPELLAGAYVDGYLYDQPTPQPVSTQPEAASADVAGLADVDSPVETDDRPQLPRRPRKRASRKGGDSE